ncbi:hypothetical protein L6252_00965, partial [Candidatus Parcubacteria bacterium]|nr:hypothetical protein [Candidatus Parcubacteria bacterium]
KLFKRKKKRGRKKKEHFENEKKIIKSKGFNDKGFSKFAVDMDIFLESEEGQPKYYFHPVLRQIVERGKNTPTEVCEGLNPLEITTRQVVETTEILFCFADSQKVDQTPVSSVHKYELLKKAYEAQKQSTEAVPEEEEAESKTKYYVLVEMEDAIKDGLLKLTPKQLDFSQSFVIQLGDDSVIEEEFLVDPLPSLEGNVSDLKKIQANLPDGVRFIFLGSQGDNVPDIFCLLKKNN